MPRNRAISCERAATARLSPGGVGTRKWVAESSAGSLGRSARAKSAARPAAPTLAVAVRGRGAALTRGGLDPSTRGFRLARHTDSADLGRDRFMLFLPASARLGGDPSHKSEV